MGLNVDTGILVLGGMACKEPHWLIDWFTLGSSPYDPDAPRPLCPII